MADGISLEQIRSALPELELSTASTYCGDSAEILLSVMEEYARSPSFDRLEECYADGDWENYRILVHTLKTSSLVIGLVELSERAKAMNEAAQARDLAFIRQNHADLMECWRDTVSRLRPLFEPR